MNAAEIISGCASGDPLERDRAAGALLDLLRTLARRSLRWSGSRTAPNDDELDDLVGEVAFKVIDGAAARIAGASESVCRSYLRRMLVNRWRDVLRQQNKIDPIGDEKEFVAPEPDPEPEFDVYALALSRLEEAFTHVLETRMPRYHDGLRQSWDQLVRLTFDGEEMEAVLASQLPAGSSEGDWIRARDRLFQNHKRLRGYLAQAIEGLEAVGRIDAQRAEETRQCLYFLLRCQRQSPAFVGKTR